MNAKRIVTAFLSLSLVWCLILAPNGALAQGKKIIEMESGAFGGYAYQMAYAFGALINKYYERVAIYNVETPGTSGGIVKVFQDPKNRITNGSSICLYEMLHGMPPFKEAYPEIRIIICYGHMSNPFVTFNPNIRSPEHQLLSTRRYKHLEEKFTFLAHQRKRCKRRESEIRYPIRAVFSQRML